MISEVHVEFACDTEIFESLKRWVRLNPQARLMLLVDSCPHCNSLLFPCDLRERYRTLAQLAPVGLHTHLFQPRHWNVNNLTYQQQYRMLENAIAFLEESNITTEHFAPGNWQFNRDTLKACGGLGLNYFHWHRENSELVEWAKTHLPAINFISAVDSYTHDWTIHQTEVKVK